MSAPERRYNVWAGNPKGRAERIEACIAEVYDTFSRLFYQCANRRGKGPEGLYCGTHARRLTLGKDVYVPTVKATS